MPTALVAVLLLATASPPAIAQLRPDSAPEPIPFLLTRMELDLRLDYRARAIRGSATLHVQNVSGQPATAVPLLLGRLLHVSNIASVTGSAIPMV